MRRHAPIHHGAPHPQERPGQSSLASNKSRHGFTLLEMCIVLFIIALLFAITIPAMQSALAEQAVRADARQISLMVKTAQLQSSDQHRNYVIDFHWAAMVTRNMPGTG